MINRVIESKIRSRLFKGKAILLLGPRQCGKSTLVENLLKEVGKPYLYMNGDDSDVRSILSNTSSTALKALIGKNELLYIDEAQRISNIGLTIKICTDQIKDVQVIATGSSSFELQQHLNEPLTGRKFEYQLFPLSFAEMVAHHGLLEEKRLLHHRLIYGYYPEIVSSVGEQEELLQLLSSSYLYKDLLMLEQIKKPVLLEKLLKALALQIGSEVSYHELAQMVGADKGTVEKYIDVLEKSFVVFRLPALNKNVRNEIKKGKKIYFYDCGIRNAVLGNFQAPENRTDTGALWENYLMAERFKWNAYQNAKRKMHFWRTTQQQEIDLVEQQEDKFDIYEFKFNAKASYAFTKTFVANYQVGKSSIITPENVEEFLM
jgi:hypothetical protein